MQPRRLESDPGPAIRTLKPSIALVAALTYNLQYDSCSGYLQDIIESGWLMKTLENLDDDVLEVCLLLADSTAEVQEPVINTLWFELAGRIPDNYRCAFDRVLQSPPRALDLESALVTWFPEILESIDRLQSREEIAYYLNLLTETQFRELQEKLSVQLSRAAIVDWTAPKQPRSRMPDQIDVLDPPRFRNAQSMVQWYNDNVVGNGSGLWNPPNPEQLMQLWDEPALPLSMSVRPGSRVLILDDAPNFSFFNYIEGKLVPSHAAAETLRAKARNSVLPATGVNTLRAAAVAFRFAEKVDELALCMRLEALDVLEDARAYLLDSGAEVSVVDPEFAARSHVSGYDAIVLSANELTGPESKFRVMQVLAGNGFERWGKLAKPLALTDGVIVPDKALVALARGPAGLP